MKVLDFGISKVLDNEDDGRTTHADTSIGTPLYMSPEQVRSSKDVDLRTDVWSLGVILHELIVGRPPFAGSTTNATAMILAQDPEVPSKLRRDVPAALDAVLFKALAKQASERYADTSALAAALLPFAAQEPIAGDRLARVVNEAAANRAVRQAPSTATSPTLIRPKRAVVAAIAAASSQAPSERAPWMWVALGLLVGLPFAAAIAYFALR